MKSNMFLRISFVVLIVISFLDCSKNDNSEVDPNINANSFTDIRDEKVYQTVRIGEQVWMAENLNYYTVDGSWIYNDSIPNASIYGRLYDWEVACVVCPFEWHLPTDEEWKVLEMFLGMTQSQADTIWGRITTGEGRKLKASSGWDNYGNGTNSSGFTALPAGTGGSMSSGIFLHIGTGGYYWTSSYTFISGSHKVGWYRGLWADSDSVHRGNRPINEGLSVRCIKNPDY